MYVCILNRIIDLLYILFLSLLSLSLSQGLSASRSIIISANLSLFSQECVCQFHFWVKDLLQTEHLQYFSFMWTLRTWEVILLLTVNDASHMGHANGFSPVCVRVWISSADSLSHPNSQPFQEHFNIDSRPRMCVATKCLFTCWGNANIFVQLWTGHKNFPATFANTYRENIFDNPPL